MNTKDREKMKKEIQEKYRRIKRQQQDDQTIANKKEAFMIAIVLFILMILNVFIKGF
nr:hypothetical protein [uncultured Bacillus sp.]